MQAAELAVVVLRWRAVGSRCVFVDALGDDGIELQLCFADGQLAADELSAGARLRVTARLEPLPTRRGLAGANWKSGRAQPRGRGRGDPRMGPRRGGSAEIAVASATRASCSRIEGTVLEDRAREAARPRPALPGGGSLAPCPLLRNLTTNEDMNKHRYGYLRNDLNQFHNPFSAGPWGNFLELFSRRHTVLTNPYSYSERYLELSRGGDVEMGECGAPSDAEHASLKGSGHSHKQSHSHSHH